MRILFLPRGCIPFHGNTLNERPLGGTESAVIRLAEVLDAYVSTPLLNPPLTDPLYIPEQSLGLLGALDVTVVVRDWRGVFIPVKTKKKFFWSGDAYDQPINVGLGDKRVLSQIDKVLCVSEWQKRTLHETAKIPEDKLSILPNGVYGGYFNKSKEKVGNRLIYSSTPYRGLVHLERLFPKIKDQVPDAELIVCSGYTVYETENGKFDKGLLLEWEEQKRRLENIEGVKVLGNLKQEDLALEFLKAKVLAYPNTFAETSCISAMEAITAECIPVTTDKGALKETIKDNGICIKSEPGDPQYDEIFVGECVRILTDDQYRKSFLKQRVFDWKSVGEKFKEIVG